VRNNQEGGAKGRAGFPAAVFLHPKTSVYGGQAEPLCSFTASWHLTKNQIKK